MQGLAFKPELSVAPDNRGHGFGVSLRPAQLPQRDHVVPDFCHVAYFTAIEFHGVDIVGSHRFASRRNRATFPGLGAMEYSKGQDGISVVVGSKTLELVVTVRHWFVPPQNDGCSIRISLEASGILPGG